MDAILNALPNLLAGFVADEFKTFLGALLAFLAARTVISWVQNRRYGGWTQEVIDSEGNLAAKRPVSPTKIQSLLDEEADLSVFIKGVASPYGWLNVDPMTKGREIGLFVMDKEKRVMRIDLSKNPPKAGGPNKG